MDEPIPPSPWGKEGSFHGEKVLWLITLQPEPGQGGTGQRGTGQWLSVDWNTLEPPWERQRPDKQNQQEQKQGVSCTFLTALLGPRLFQAQTKEI